MTVILDPGNDANSYSDGQRRQWKATSGLWKTDAKDNSGGTHPSGYVAGQLWSATAGQWQTMYDSMVVDRDLWHGRADNAWGASRVWNSGESWEAAYNRVLPPATGESFVGNASCSLGSAGGSATATYTTSSNDLSATNNSSSVTVPKTGIYEVFIALTGANNTGNSGDTCTVTLSGNVHGTLDSRGFAIGTQKSFGWTRYRGTLNAGETVSVTAATNWDAFSMTGLLVITFVPTQTYPH